VCVLASWDSSCGVIEESTVVKEKQICNSVFVYRKLDWPFSMCTKGSQELKGNMLAQLIVHLCSSDVEVRQHCRIEEFIHCILNNALRMQNKKYGCKCGKRNRRKATIHGHMYSLDDLLLFPNEVSLFLAYSLTLRMEAVRSCKTSLNFYHTTRRHIPEENAVLRYRYDNLKSERNCVGITRNPSVPYDPSV
jgi:hypothetical protein